MKTFISINIPLVFLFIFYSGSLTGQTNKDLGMYEWLDTLIGDENVGLFNGVAYVEQHRTINEKHQFFNKEFVPGVLFYGGQPYPEALLKYNVYDQVLLIKAPTSNGETILQLINEKIDSFSFGEHQFENLDGMGFFEILLKTPSLSLYKKHSKKMEEKKDKSFVYYEFEPEDEGYVIHYNSTFHQVDSRRDLVKLFPEHKKKVRSYFRSNRKLKKSNPDLFLMILLTEIPFATPKEK